MLRKPLTFTYGAIAYVAFLGALLYTIGFLAGAVVPKDLDDGLCAPPGRRSWRTWLCWVCSPSSTA